MDTLPSDFFRFSLQHSWYKHIDLTGATFWAYQQKGQQPRNGIHPEVTDASGIHWWFSSIQPSAEIASYQFQAGPFLRGLEKSGEITWGIHIIVEDAGAERFETWIQNNYPQWGHIKADEWSSMDLKDPILIELYRSEQTKYYHSLLRSIQRSPES